MKANKTLLAVVPWSASGPGWANSGVTVYWEDAVTGQVERETVYRDMMSREANLLFPHALSLYEAFAEAIVGTEGGTMREESLAHVGDEPRAWDYAHWQRERAERSEAERDAAHVLRDATVAEYRARAAAAESELARLRHEIRRLADDMNDWRNRYPAARLGRWAIDRARALAGEDG